MSTSDSLHALRHANPRTAPDFADAVEAVRGQLDTSTPLQSVPSRASRSRRRLVGASAAGVALAAAIAAIAVLTIGTTGSGPGVETAAAAIKKAASVTAVSAERSGTAVVRITHDGQVWAGKTVRWNGPDVEISGDATPRDLLVVHGRMYAPDPEHPGGWLDMGSPESIDPGSGTTPSEYLAAVREDVGGTTLRRITGAMTALTTQKLSDGSTVYSGTVAAGQIARETGFKEGQSIRVLPFGYVAHDEAADPASPLVAAVTVGADGVFREIRVSWGTWVYTVAYSDLGSTPAPQAPTNATPLRRALRG